MASVDGFSHLVVHVTDLDRSEKFYREVFGLDVIGRNLVNDEGENSLLAMNTRQRVLLVKMPEVVPFRPNSNSIHHAWYLTPEQYERAQARLQSMGIDITDSRKDFRAKGEHSFDVFDPDGHRYQVQTHTAEAKEILKEDVGAIVCGNIADYPVGSVKAFVKGKFFLVHLPDGFIALSRWCTHMNGLLSWRKEHWQFYCPMHGAVYNRKGECTTFGRDLPPLRQHPITIAEDGTITVRPDEVIVREQFDLSQLTPVASAEAPSAAHA